jgi:hypothetical protein
MAEHARTANSPGASGAGVSLVREQPRLGYTSPRFASPDFTSPDYEGGPLGEGTGGSEK